MKQVILPLLIIAACLQLNTHLQAQTATDFTLTDIDGNSHTLFNYLDAGQTVVLYCFFIECGNCNFTTPLMQDIYEDFGGEDGCVTVLALDIYNANTESAIASYKASKGATFPFIASSTNSNLTSIASNQFGDNIGTPAVMVIGPDATIVSATQTSSAFPDGTIVNAIEEVVQPNCFPVAVPSVIEANTTLTAYPNPANNHLQINSNNFNAPTVSLYNTYGQTVFFSTQLNAQSTINVTHLPAGLYLLKLTEAGKSSTKKIQIVH